MSEQLVAFLYLLMRDKVPTGDVEDLVAKAEKADKPMFSGIYLESYAKQLAMRLQP